MSVYLEMGLIAIFPLTTSVILHFFFKGKNIKYWDKQQIVGLIFGLLAIIGTEFGVPLNGAVLNARDAAPLCAGLIFGAPAGIIAGLIGGIERWLCVLWGGGTYTRLACTIATIISGFIGALLKKYMFENKIPRWQYALAIGLVAETIHMTMVFVTNGSDIYRAFLVVKSCTFPMLIINSLAVTLAVFAINVLDKDELYDKKGEKITLSQQFQKSILIVVVAALAFISIFTLNIQNSVSESTTAQTLTTGISDLESSVESMINEYMFDTTNLIKKDVLELETVNNSEISCLAEKYSVDDINVVDEFGEVVFSNNLSHIGYDMRTVKQSKDFICLLESQVRYSQEIQKNAYEDIEYKYVGISYSGGFIQVGIEGFTYSNKFVEFMQVEAKNKHIGENGGVVILDRGGNIVANSALIDNEDFKIDNIDTNNQLTVYENNVNGVPCYAATKTINNCTIITYVPVEDIVFARDLLIYLNIFMEVIVFAAIFIVMYFLVGYHVVTNVRCINDDLKEITDGNLNVVVDHNDNQEFASLSKGINMTVDAMKNLIDEASKRIDSELQYAAQIQESSLPKYFEENENYDLFALMDPAKEVGGDFYDFYKLNDHTLVITIADVSGKGIPASLFMMRAKSILKTYAEAGLPIADIFTNANAALCEGNDAGLFVTAWMGFVNLETGEVKFANAGHNLPLIRHKDGEYDFLASKAGFVLGGMEGIHYKEQTCELLEGDEIFLYTDGAPEATNINNELFGDERLKTSINLHWKNSAKDTCNLVKRDVDNFFGEAPQFDDITMLSLKVNKFVK